MNLIFRKLKDTDNFDNLAELIYRVDPYCYKDIFGDLEKAKKVLKVLMYDEKSTFYKDNYYCVECDNQIVGIASFFFHFVTWEDGIIEDAFGKLNLPIPNTYYAVAKYFKEMYNYRSLGASTCQVCVKEEYQNKGIGSFLIKNILDIYGKQDIQLNVLANNDKAVHLYKKYGFIIVNVHNDYAGLNQPEVKSYLMYRPGKQ